MVSQGNANDLIKNKVLHKRMNEWHLISANKRTGECFLRMMTIT